MLETVLLLFLGFYRLTCEEIQCRTLRRKEQDRHGQTQQDQAPEREEADSLASRKQSGQQTYHADKATDGQHVRLIGGQSRNAWRECTKFGTSDLYPIEYRLLEPYRRRMIGGGLGSMFCRLHLRTISFGNGLVVVRHDCRASFIDIGIDDRGRRELRQQEATNPEEKDADNNNRTAIEQK